MSKKKNKVALVDDNEFKYRTMSMKDHVFIQVKVNRKDVTLSVPVVIAEKIVDAYKDWKKDRKRSKRL